MNNSVLTDLLLQIYYYPRKEKKWFRLMFLPFMLPLKQYHKAVLFFALSLRVVVECPASGSLERGQMENFTGYREGNFVA